MFIVQKVEEIGEISQCCTLDIYSVVDLILGVVPRNIKTQGLTKLLSIILYITVQLSLNAQQFLTQTTF